jgi:Cof subfamily protein (haloacid dehalogenase superfamily)
MPKMIFLDIDGTLCEPGNPVSQVTIDALHQAQKNGHKIFISTGRNVPIIPKDITAIGFDGIIASAGGYVLVGDTVLEDKHMPDELLAHAIKVFHKYDINYMLETASGTYADLARYQVAWENSLAGTNSEMRRLMIMLFNGLGVKPMAEYQNKPVYKICFISKSEETMVKAVEELGDSFDTVIQDNLVKERPRTNGETMAKGVDKGSAVQKICDYFGVGLEDAIAFGDSSNDLPMLKVAGTGVAMGNAAPSVKKTADVVCESCAEDGIAHQLERMGVI